MTNFVNLVKFFEAMDKEEEEEEDEILSSSSEWDSESLSSASESEIERDWGHEKDLFIEYEVKPTNWCYVRDYRRANCLDLGFIRFAFRLFTMFGYVHVENFRNIIAHFVYVCHCPTRAMINEWFEEIFEFKKSVVVGESKRFETFRFGGAIGAHLQKSLNPCACRVGMRIVKSDGVERGEKDGCMCVQVLEFARDYFNARQLFWQGSRDVELMKKCADATGWRESNEQLIKLEFIWKEENLWKEVYGGRIQRFPELKNADGFDEFCEFCKTF